MRRRVCLENICIPVHLKRDIPIVIAAVVWRIHRVHVDACSGRRVFAGDGFGFNDFRKKPHLEMWPINYRKYVCVRIRFCAKRCVFILPRPHVIGFWARRRTCCFFYTDVFFFSKYCLYNFFVNKKSVPSIFTFPVFIHSHVSFLGNAYTVYEFTISSYTYEYLNARSYINCRH